MMKFALNRVCARLLLGAALCLGACSNSETENASSDVEEETQVLRIITWEDYVAPEVVEAFTEKTGIEVQISSFENTEDLMGILRAYSHRYDLIILDNSSLDRFRHNELLRELDRDRIEGFTNLESRFVNTPSDPGNKYSVPYLWGTTLVAYRNDKVKDPEASFELLFDEALKGKVLMLDDMFESMAVPLILQGDSINCYDEPTLRAATDRLKAETKANGIRYVSDKKIRDALESGEAWAALCYSGDAAWVAEDCPEVSYFFPKEGASLWLDTMVVSAEAENVDEAYAFLNFLLEPEIAAMSANSLWYATPNRLAQSLLDEELVSDTALVPTAEMLEGCEYFVEIPATATSLFSKLSREIRAESPQPEETVSVPSAE